MSVGTNIQTINFNKPIQQNAQMTFKSQTVPVKDYSPDTVEINGKKKTRMSNGAKIGIGALGIATIVIGIVARKTKQLKQVAEHIDFKEAKSIEEAIKWGKENLGITNYEKYDNLEVLNWINKGITDIQNKIPLKERLFKKIKFESAGINGFQARCDCGKELVFNKDILINIDNLFSKDIYDYKLIMSAPNKSYKNINSIKQIEKIIQNYEKNNHLSWNEKIKFHEYMRKIWFIDDKSVNLSLKEIEHLLNSVNPHYIISHEAGHVLHRRNVGEKIFGEMGKIKEIEEWGAKNKAITEEFLNTKSIQETAGKVSLYAKESPLEFVAETFAQILEGRKFSDEVMALYKKYNGPSI